MPGVFPTKPTAGRRISNSQRVSLSGLQLAWKIAHTVDDPQHDHFRKSHSNDDNVTTDGYRANTQPEFRSGSAASGSAPANRSDEERSRGSDVQHQGYRSRCRNRFGRGL